MIDRPARPPDRGYSGPRGGAMAPEHGLRADDRVKAEDLLYSELYHPRDRGLLAKAFVVAAVLHVALIFVRLPAAKDTVQPQPAPDLLVVKKFVPPPPARVERAELASRQLARRMPIPDPAPGALEPIREPDGDDDAPMLPPDAEYFIGVPEPPPPTGGPFLAGVDDVSNPVLIEETKVEPIYPELARTARIEGTVLLQAVIEPDGRVSEVEVQRCNRPNLGFEDSAAAAVKRWRYKPAIQRGKPVAVYLTVFVEFKLH